MGALNQRAIQKMEEGLIKLIDELLDDMEDLEAVDIIGDFAARIPIEVIGNLLDVPRDERQPLRGWSLAILSALEAAVRDRQWSIAQSLLAERALLRKTTPAAFSVHAAGRIQRT